MKLGVCYYPEHWPESIWQEDARRMRELGLRVVRVGEFAWSRLEPTRDNFQFDWLHRAIEVLHAEGLEVVMGTPTATPPKWLIDEHPGIIAIDEQGQPKGFGSRRHYCFSSEVYRNECRRITEKVVQEFGLHDAITTWQTDNEYGCHSTIVSYSQDALRAFQQWCEQRYKTIERLNEQWGNVFWSMEYTSFAQIPLPMLSVTELNPAHHLAFWRFSSDQVVSFNRLQADLIRKYSPGREVMHNFMGNFTEFDHYTVAQDLDIAAWDNYPLGFLDRDGVSRADQQKWYRTGHPDSSAFHHDLYRGMGKLWVIEQQPGPVNWAPHNPAPLDGMVRLWALEALAHGAELMSWFRWRQAPFAQEQMHTALLRPDDNNAAAAEEVLSVAAEIAIVNAAIDHAVMENKGQKPPVAMVFDYHGDQMQRIQPQGQNYDALDWVRQFYTATRSCGVDVDIVGSHASLNDYQMVVLSNSVVVDDKLLASLTGFGGTVLLGPRIASKTNEFSIPQNLPPGNLQNLLPIKVTRVESLPDFVSLQSTDGFKAVRWREQIEADLTPASTFGDGWGFHYSQNNIHYLNACLDESSLSRFVRARLADANIHCAIAEDAQLGEGVRIRRLRNLLFVFNYGPGKVVLDPVTDLGVKSGCDVLLGSYELAPAQVVVLRL